MATQLPTESDWLNNPSDLSAVANAKLALAVMELVQSMRCQIRRRDSSGFGELFGPAFLQCPKELHKALGKVLRDALECTEEELSAALFVPADVYEEREDELLTTSALTGPRKRKAHRENLQKNTVEPADRHIDLLVETPGPSDTPGGNHREEIVELIMESPGHDWILEMLKKPTAHSRRLFAAASKVLRNFLAKSEAQSQATLGNNIGLLRSALDLDESEVRFLELANIVQRATVDTTVFSFVNRPLLLRQALAMLCGIDPRKHSGILSSQGSLRSSGILEAHSGYNTDLGDLLRLSDIGERLLFQPFQSMQDMASAVLEPITSTDARALEWPHLQTDSHLLTGALRAALATQAAGINILLHGAPGTGKTEFSKYLCTQLQCSAYTVLSADQDGKEAERSDRLSSLRLCQRLAGESGNAVLVLDEAEDIFQNNHGSIFGQLLGKRQQESKGWTNQLLETNKHPVIWISNTISHLDPAYVRRFAYVMEFRTPPRAQRLVMAAQHLEPVGASPDLLQRLSHNPHLTPAMLASAAQFTALAQAGQAASAQKNVPDRVVQHHITRQIQALGLSTVGTIPDLVTRFDTRYLNVEGKVPAEQVTASLVRTLRGSAVFAGPPGTGKTQLAAHIAERANLELLYRTASDINSMWFGQSERNVARLFEDCDINHQMILLDEADILLMTRNSDANRPERAVTAEFLRRLEAFKGIFICATNHSDMFDAALMRRFIFRLEFAPLTLTQRCQMFAELALQVPVAEVAHDLPTKVVQALTKLDRLTPGDFANVKKRFSTLSQTANAEDWLTELQQEQAVKGERANTPMGFVN